MEIKTSPAMQVLYSAHQVTLADLGKLAGVVVKEIMAEAVHNGWLLSGPCIWIYRGADGEPNTVFDLEIAMPVQGTGKTGRFSSKKLLPFKCAYQQHDGDWINFPATYAHLIQDLGAHNQVMTGEFREVYLNMDFGNPDNNRTEIQVGLM